MHRRHFAALAAAAVIVPPTPLRAAKPLKITKITATEVRGIVTGKGLVLPWDPKQEPQDTRDYVIVQIFTDQGIVGTTMDGDYKLPKGIAAEALKHAEPYFIGKDPFDVALHDAQFFQKVKAPVRLFFLDIALWDIIGKALGQPLYRVWGAYTSKVQPYAATVHFIKTAQQRVDDALKFYELGFRAIKLRLHKLTIPEDLEMPRKVIDAVRGKMDVMVDANHAGKRKTDPPPVWDVERSKRTALALEEMSLFWLEEPLPRHDFDGLAPPAPYSNACTSPAVKATSASPTSSAIAPNAATAISSPTPCSPAPSPLSAKSQPWPKPSASPSAPITARAASAC
ncbi:MAG: hypothetical protein JST93_09310 [Acidobacteria bacterium]|nr:hypothetical protein [Acidobacteriota bacterium]